MTGKLSTFERRIEILFFYNKFKKVTLIEALKQGVFLSIQSEQ